MSLLLKINGHGQAVATFIVNRIALRPLTTDSWRFLSMEEAAMTTELTAIV